jgi:hypothetical protein
MSDLFRSSPTEVENSVKDSGFWTDVDMVGPLMLSYCSSLLWEIVRRFASQNCRKNFPRESHLVIIVEDAQVESPALLDSIDSTAL